MWLQAEALKELIAREEDGKLPTHPSIEVRACPEACAETLNPPVETPPSRDAQDAGFHRSIIMSGRFPSTACTTAPTPPPAPSHIPFHCPSSPHSLCVPMRAYPLSRLT
jgi:hypothetical protein